MAIHDLLFSEGDRHTGNVHIDEGFNLRFIDNDNALGQEFGARLWGRIRGLDSIFLPATARAATVRALRLHERLQADPSRQQGLDRGEGSFLDGWMDAHRGDTCLPGQCEVRCVDAAARVGWRCVRR